MIRSKKEIKEIIDQHQQKKDNSCVPSSVEMVLKLLGRVKLDFYDLQKGCTNGCFSEYDGKTINGVTFQRINLAKRNSDFPFEELSQKIKEELLSDRYVIITFLGLTSKGKRKFHAYVVYDEDPSQNDFLTVTKASSNGNYVTQFNTGIKSEIRNSKGTDILIYKITESHQDR